MDMPRKSLTYNIRLTKWFPANDELAFKVARICILREDFLMEMNGIYSEQIEALDGSWDQYRKTYFIRNMFRTLAEIVGGIRRVREDPEFIRLLAKESADVKLKFENHQKAFAAGIQTLKAWRDSIGGHLQEATVKQTLNELTPEMFGLFEIGKTSKQTYFKFAGDLIAQAFVTGVQAGKKRDVFRERNQQIGGLLPAFSLIEQILLIYIHGRGLL
jgi:hypothetical protein